MIRAALLFVLCAACGGKIDGDDGGTAGGTDASTSADASKNADVTLLPDVSTKPTCTLGTGSGTVSTDGTCSSSQGWSCGEIDFSVTCDCPQATCTCQGGTPETVSTSIACPSCDVTSNLAQLAALCGYPAP